MSEPYVIEELNIPEESEIPALLRQCPDIQPVLFRDGEYMIRQDDEGADIYLVLRGSYVVEQAISDDDPKASASLDIVVSHVDNPVFVGEMAYLGHFARTASVRCSGCTYTLCLKPEHLNIILDYFPELTRVLCRRFAERLKRTNELFHYHQQRLAMKTRQVICKKDELIVKKGTPADTLYQLVIGGLRREPGGEIITEDSCPHGFVEAEAYLRGGVYSSDIRAEDRAVLVAIDASSRLAVIRNFAEMTLDILQKG